MEKETTVICVMMVRYCCGPCLPVHDGRDEGVTLEIGIQCYLGDEGQTSLQAWPARPLALVLISNQFLVSFRVIDLINQKLKSSCFITVRIRGAVLTD